jgi:hypothetical protein
VTAENVRTTAEGPGGAAFAAEGQEEFATSTYLVSHVYTPDVEWILEYDSISKRKKKCDL